MEQILDMFLGSGTSAIEAVNMGRRCIGVELKSDLAGYVKDKFTENQLIDSVQVIAGDSASDNIVEKIGKATEKFDSEKKTTDIQDPDHDLIYSPDYDPRPNHKRRITKASSKIEKTIKIKQEWIS